MARMKRTGLVPNSLQTTALIIAGAAVILTGCGGAASEADKRGDTMTVAPNSQHTKTGGSHEHANEAEAVAAHTHTTRLEFSSEPTAIPVGKEATWTLKVVDVKTGQPVPEFDLVHEKLLHLIVVSNDLSWFNHIHPEYKGNGVFVMTTALPKEGSYKLYADYTPKGKSQEVAQHEFATGGSQVTPTMVLPVVDSLGDGGWIVRRVGSSPEGFPEKKSGSYEVALMPMPGKIKAGQDVMLHFQVRDAAGKPLASLEPYLGAMGHAVLLSSDTKIYLHTHPMDGGDHGGMDHGGMNHGTAGSDSASKSKTGAKKAGSDVIFHTNFPAAGLYKVWGQFQHNGKIVTAPFVLRVEAAA